MKKVSAEKLAGVLKVLVTITFVCNLIALFFVPGMAFIKSAGGVAGLVAYENPLELPLRLLILCAHCWSWVLWVFSENVYAAVLSGFLLFCGSCTAVILWQARRVLNSVLAGETFTLENSANMKRAAICCLLISGAALVRLIWGFTYYQSIRPLLTYNALFVPVFAMGFLLCMVMSALFRQAAEIKAENDLTI